MLQGIIIVLDKTILPNKVFRISEPPAKSAAILLIYRPFKVFQIVLVVSGGHDKQ